MKMDRWPTISITLSADQVYDIEIAYRSRIFQ